MRLRLSAALASLALAAAPGCERSAPPPTPEAPSVVLTDPPPALPGAGAAGPAAEGALPAGHPPLDGADRRPPPGPVDPSTPLPPGHPPITGGAAPAGAPVAGGEAVAAEQGGELPLPLEGSGGLSELAARTQKLPEALRADFDLAFRLVFTLERPKRDAARAQPLVDKLIAAPEVAAQAAGHRLAGYLAINRGFDSVAALASYRKAVELDPNYGEAHYALSFTLAISDLAAGKVHFERAVALGVPDTRGLRGQFYGDAR
jgi:hypothetical protein